MVYIENRMAKIQAAESSDTIDFNVIFGRVHHQKENQVTGNNSTVIFGSKATDLIFLRKIYYFYCQSTVIFGRKYRYIWQKKGCFTVIFGRKYRYIWQKTPLYLAEITSEKPVGRSYEIL